MAKLNTYDEVSDLAVALQLIGIIPGEGDTFRTVRVTRGGLQGFIEQFAGKDGDPGAKLLLQKTATHVQYGYEGIAGWTNLIALADLKGDKGEAGTGLKNRGNWVAATYQPGDYVFAEGSVNPTSMWVLNDTVAFASSVVPKADTGKWIELAAPAGADGKQIEVRVFELNFQWRYAGDADWQLLGPTNQFPTWVDKGTVSAAATVTLNIADGESQRVQVGAATTIAFLNWPVAGKLSSVLIEMVNGKAFPLTWPVINWIKADGTITTDFGALGQPLQTAGTDWILVWSRNAGATIWGKVIR